MALAFLPLFFAVASLARATLREAREESAEALGRVVAAHVGEAAREGTPETVQQRAQSHVGQAGVAGIMVCDRDGAMLVQAGDEGELARMRCPARPYGESSQTVHGERGRALDVVVPAGTSAFVARVRTDDSAALAAPLVRLVALYMVSFALALLVFAYFALTRLIVRPVDALVRAADRVASARVHIDVPETGARELLLLAASMRAMATRLVVEQAAMQSKVLELTRTTTRLTETRSQLVRSERMASVGRLAAGVAHEIGNPLAALMGMQELLRDDDLPRETRQDFLARMTRETERIHTVLRDLLDFARPEKIESGTDSLHPPANVALVVEDVFGLVRPQKAFKSVALKTEIPSVSPVALLPAGRLTQVILNLVLNAGDAIETAARDREGTITVRASTEEGRVRIEVQDDGPGIPPQIVDQLFEPFVTSKEIGKGTGLGLAVCRGIVESAKGEILLDAAFAGGTKFVITLPAG
jgi:two-component system, NtrC family, sensor kinase